MFTVLSAATKVLFDILCIAGVQEVTSRVHRTKFPHRKFNVGQILQQSVAAMSLLLFVVAGLRPSSFLLSRIQSIHLALAIWTKLRTSAFYERLGLVAFVWTHCLQNYSTWNVMSLMSLRSLWACCSHIPRAPPWLWEGGEILTVMAILSWVIWTRDCHWTLYMYALYLPWEWVEKHPKKE